TASSRSRTSRARTSTTSSSSEDLAWHQRTPHPRPRGSQEGHDMGSHSADERTTTWAAAAEVGLAPAATAAVRTTAAVADMTAPRISAARGLVAAVCVAGALALTGCGLLPRTGTGTDEPCGSDQAGCVQVDSSEEPTDGGPTG